MTVQELISRCQEYRVAGNHQAGVVLCNEVLDKGAKGRLRATALRLRAAILLAANPNWVGEAVEDLKQAAELTQRYPDDQALIYTTLGAAYSPFGSYVAAEKVANRLFALAAEHKRVAVASCVPQMWFNLAIAYDNARLIPQAVNAYEMAVKTAHLSDAFSPALPVNNLVQIYLELDRKEDAYEMLERARVSLDMSTYGYHFADQEAQCFIAQGKAAEAKAACNLVLSASECPSEVQAEVTLTLAHAHAIEGDMERFTALLNQAQDLAIRLHHPRLMHKIERLTRAFV